MIAAAPLQPLVDALQERRLALFIGGDLPRSVTGLPSRVELAQGMARQYNLDPNQKLAEVAERVGSPYEFITFIRRALEVDSEQTEAFHQRIVDLVQGYNLKALVTTAYDNRLAQTLRRAKIPFDLIADGTQTYFMSPDRPFLIHLYGHVNQPEGLVVTDRDHTQLLRDPNKAGLIDEVRRVFKHYACLFIGYNLADADFRFIFEEIAGTPIAPRAYAVWPDLPPADIQMWQRRNITILEEDPFEILGQLVPMLPPPIPEQVEVGLELARLADPELLVRLHLLLMNHFNVDQLVLLAAAVGLDYEALAGQEKARKVHELLLALARRKRLAELVQQARQRRPAVSWPAKAELDEGHEDD